jgi:tetratricopeptide (TPR) repeat protein
VSEEQEGPESGPEGIGAGIDPTAAALALAGASRAKADAFLDKQSSLIDIQKHHLHEQFKHLHLSVWEKQLGVWLKAATFCVGIAVAAGVGLMVWEAAHSKGLIIEPFAVPPDMAAKGLSGEVVAGQILDKLTQMQSVTISSRPPQSYARNWGNDVKVEIPDTGISIAEIQRLLRDWLGHDTRISGEVWHTPAGLAVAVRTGGVGGELVTGSEGDFDGLMQKAAEQVYGSTQPYRYANYLDRNYYRPGVPLRIAEARAIYQRLIYDPDPLERGWAWNGLGTLAYSVQGDDKEAARLYYRALSAQPDLPIAYSALTSAEERLGHAEAALWAARNWARVTSSQGSATASSAIPHWLGDFASEAALCRRAADAPVLFRQVNNRDQNEDCIARALAGQHDGGAIREWIAEVPPAETAQELGRRPTLMLRIDAAFEKWNALAASEAAAEEAYFKGLPGWDRRTITSRVLRPMLALAKANLGDSAGATAIIAATPGDCYDCMRIRGTIASLAGETGRADYWFARAAIFAPSIPYALRDWGQSRLARGELDSAITMFQRANKLGPKFSDPLEGWGEALMAKNQSHLALAKFEEANKYAPNWGRLHLKWGEALLYAGRPDEAKKQFAIAAGLDLVAPDKVELLRMSAHG